MGQAGSLRGAPAPRRAFEEPRDGFLSLRRGEAGRGGGEKGRMPGSGKERGGGDKGRTSAASPREAVSPGDSGRGRPRAYTPHKAPRAHAPPCGSSRPATRLHAHAAPALCPDSRAYRDPQGQARGAAVPRGPRTRVHTLAYAHPDRGATTQRPPPRHPVHQPLAPTASRVFTPTPRSVTGAGHAAVQFPEAPKRGRWRPARTVSRCAPCPGVGAVLPPAAVRPHLLLAPLRLRLRLRPGLPRGLAGAGWVAEAAAAAEAERAAAGAGTPSRRQKPPSSRV